MMNIADIAGGQISESGRNRELSGVRHEERVAINKGDLSEKKRKEFRHAAKEMESLFAYELLKVMRETSRAISGEKKGLGNDTYMSMFDIEVSKLMAQRGLGLQDAIIKWLENMPGVNSSGTAQKD